MEISRKARVRQGSSYHEWHDLPPRDKISPFLAPWGGSCDLPVWTPHMAGRLSCPTALAWFGLITLWAGCERGEELIPVAGKVTLQGRPLTAGAVSFRPDVVQGNTSLHHPTGSIDREGKYRLSVGKRDGAPPGRYKVIVIANEPEVENSKQVHPGMPKLIIDRRYTWPDSTPLAADVRPDAPPGSFDFEVEPPR
jgi:hypothetical protein